jgi:molybdopterin molybdotransferase
MISFDEAIERIERLARPLPAERVQLQRADGRVLTAPVISQRASPARAVSAMDGYAVREADLGESCVRLRVAGESFAGAVAAGRLRTGACMRIFTGAPVPAGADRVIVQEEVKREGDLAVLPPRQAGRRHVRAAGSDFRPGEILVPAGAVLNPQRLVAAAAADLAWVEVVRKPTLVLVGTGDELREPGRAGAPGSIPESVSFGVAALARRWGAEVVGRWRLTDELTSLRRAAQAALDSAEVVVVTGGASVGERDFAKAMFDWVGLELVIPKVAIRPGKPVWLGCAGERLVVGLPGNPSAALVTARLFLAPLLAGLGGLGAGRALAWRTAALARPLQGCGDRETFHRARWVEPGVEPLDDQDSSGQKSLAMADALIRRRAGQVAQGVGEPVSVLDL